MVFLVKIPWIIAGLLSLACYLWFWSDIMKTFLGPFSFSFWFLVFWHEPQRWTKTPWDSSVSKVTPGRYNVHYPKTIRWWTVDWYYYGLQRWSPSPPLTALYWWRLSQNSSLDLLLRISFLLYLFNAKIYNKYNNLTFLTKILLRYQ